MTDVHYFCHWPQRQAVMSDLVRYGFSANPRNVHGVGLEDMSHMAGVTNGVFVNIATFGQRIPEDLLRYVEMRGLVVLTINDRFMRERYGRGG